MAFLGVKVPSEVGDLLKQVEVPGLEEPKDRFHITILNLGDDIPIDELGRASIATYSVISKTRPFQVTVRTVHQFPSGKTGVPVIALVESPMLHAFHEACKRSYDEIGVDFSRKFPEFKPHITLAYSDPGTDMRPMPITPITWTVSDIVLWGGDTGENRVVTRFPLEISPPMTAAARVASRAGGQNLAALRVASRYLAACEGGVCTCNGECGCGKRPLAPVI